LQNQGLKTTNEKIRKTKIGFKMSNFDTFVSQQLENDDVRREYHRLEPYYRLANQLILLRKKRGLTQQELAARVGTTQAVISRLENVTVHCSLELVIRLAEALGASLGILLSPLEDTAPVKAIDEQAEADCAEYSIDAQKGVVFFNIQSSTPCTTFNPISFDTLSGQNYTPARQPRKRFMEIA
jgi:transcriptional regulator with XRE-family HTH domain